MSYHPEADNHILDKLKVVLDLSNYANKKELKDATRVDTSGLAAKKVFMALKAEVEKLGINKLVNVPSGFNNLKERVDDLDTGKLKTVPIDLKELSEVLSKEVVKKTVYSKSNMKVKNLENKTPDATTLIHINQYNTDKQSLKKKMEMSIKKNTLC